LLYWEAAEGGTGVWERLIDEADSFMRLAAEALKVCHFEPSADAAERVPCTSACYECLMSYSNQPHHRYLDRRTIQAYLASMAAGSVASTTEMSSRDEQYERLKLLVDSRSQLEREFLDFLYENGYRLPDRAQNRPEPKVYAQPDFYYERSGLPGVCVFVDGAVHDMPDQSARDEAVRAALEDLGYRVIAIRSPFDQHVGAHPDVFNR
jgi:hypothetical protein